MPLRKTTYVPLYFEFRALSVTVECKVAFMKCERRAWGRAGPRPKLAERACISARKLTSGGDSGFLRLAPASKTEVHKHRGSSSLTPDCAKDSDCAKRTPIRSKARAPSPQSTIASPPATRCALARSLAAAARCCACTPPLLLLPAACAHCWRMTATIARRCHCAGAARRQVLSLSVPRVLPYMASPHPFYTACTLAHARAAHARHTHSSCAGETRRPNQLLSHVDVCLALLRLLKMLSKFTESEANKKMMGEKMSGKVIAAASVIASYEERGEGECTHTPVSTTISTAGGPASPSREWPCSSIACDGCDQHAHRPLAVRACRRARGRRPRAGRRARRRPCRGSSSASA